MFMSIELNFRHDKEDIWWDLNRDSIFRSCIHLGIAERSYGRDVLAVRLPHMIQELMNKKKD